MKKIHLALWASLASLACVQVSAQNAGEFYGGAGVGKAQSKIDHDRINAGLIGAGATSTSMTHDQKDTTYKIYGGYQFAPYLGIEAGYFKLGSFGFNSTTLPAGTLDGRIQIEGMNIDLVGNMPVNDQFFVLGRIGVHNARARDTFTSTGAIVVTNDRPEFREVNYKMGLGLGYKFSQSVSLRGEIERYRINDAVGNRGDVNVATISLVFPFGKMPEPAPQVVEKVVYRDAPAAATPPVVAPPPPVETPKPVPVPEPVAETKPAKKEMPVSVPERLRVSFNADVFFGFDRATVSPAGKQALDKFTNDLNGVEYDHITIEGHTDRLGTQIYNEKLSLQRAEAVKTYLLSRGSIPANKISTVGKGSSEPTTDAGACKGNRATAAVVACLKPDRRVDLDVAGTKAGQKQ